MTIPAPVNADTAVPINTPVDTPVAPPIAPPIAPPLSLPLVRRFASSIRSRASLTVDIIETYADLEALRPAWDALHRRDPESGIFMSWAWLAAAFQQNPQRWRVIAIRPSRQTADYVCIFPMKYRVHWSASTAKFQSEIEAGGRLGWSEYTGFLCDPDWEEPALQQLAQTLSFMPWSRLSLRYESSERRAALFTDAFATTDFTVNYKTYMINNGETDNLKCPQIDLPDDFETYLSDKVSYNSRKKIRKATRRYIDDGDYHFTQSSPETAEQDCNRLLGFWLQQWRESKGQAQAEYVAGNYQQVLGTAHDLDALFIQTLWQGDTPLGALGFVLDPPSRALHCIVTGRDIAAQDPAIGLLMHANAIRWAIEHGFRLYDFGHGDEPYKYSFGPQTKRVKYFSIRPKNSRDGFVLDFLSLPEALGRTTKFLEQGETKAALAACRQMTEMTTD